MPTRQLRTVLPQTAAADRRPRNSSTTPTNCRIIASYNLVLMKAERLRNVSVIINNNNKMGFQKKMFSYFFIFDNVLKNR
jgi:hypothetical protein